jgi:hypothetical protein
LLTYSLQEFCTVCAVIAQPCHIRLIPPSVPSFSTLPSSPTAAPHVPTTRCPVPIMHLCVPITTQHANFSKHASKLAVAATHVSTTAPPCPQQPPEFQPPSSMPNFKACAQALRQQQHMRHWRRRPILCPPPVFNHHPACQASQHASKLSGSSNTRVNDRAALSPSSCWSHGGLNHPPTCSLQGLHRANVPKPFHSNQTCPLWSATMMPHPPPLQSTS